MNIYFKTISFALIALFLYIILLKEGRDYAVVLSVAVCCLVLICAMQYLKPVIDFVKELDTLADLDHSVCSLILQSVGVAVIAEIIGLLCTDAGYASLGKSVQVLATAAILWLSLPLFKSLIALIEEIMVAI